MVTPIQRTQTRLAVKAERARREAMCDVHDAVRQTVGTWDRWRGDPGRLLLLLDDLMPALSASWDSYESACKSSDEAEGLERTAWNGAHGSDTHRVLRSRYVLDILPRAEG